MSIKQNQLLDWFQNYSISTDFLTVFTSTGNQTLNLLKPFLKDFYPGSIIKLTTIDKPVLKSNFGLLIKTIINQKPKLITDLILKQNPQITNVYEIPFNTLLKSTKKLFTCFINILFQNTD